MGEHGRPTKYDSSIDDLVYKYMLLGATLEELADFLEVATSTVYLWLQKHSGFSEAVNRGRAQADAKVAEALYKRALGFEYTEIKTEGVAGEDGNVSGKRVTKTRKQVAPDTAAAFIWLKNRQPGKWKDRQQIDHTVDLSESSYLERLQESVKKE